VGGVAPTARVTNLSAGTTLYSPSTSVSNLQTNWNVTARVREMEGESSLRTTLRLLQLSPAFGGTG
jgi:hypothetical protein